MEHEPLAIAYDRDDSTEMNPRYFVYDTDDNCVLYKGTYSQCLCVIVAIHLNPDITLEEIRNKSNGYV